MSGKYLKARELAKEMEEKAKKTAEEREKATDNLERAEELVEISKELGSDVSEAEELIEKARADLEERNLEESTSKVEEALEILRDSNAERIEELIDATVELHDMIDDESFYEESKSRLDKSRELMEDEKYKESLETAKEALDLAELEVQEKLTEEFGNIDSMLLKLEDKDKDTGEVEDLLSKAKQAADEEEIEEAFTLVNGCKEKLRAEMKEYLDNKLEGIEKQCAIVRETGGNTGEIEELISKAKARTKDNEFEKSMDFIDEARGELDDAMKGVVEDGLEKLDDEIEEAKELNADLDPIYSLLDKVKDLQTEEKYSQAYEKLEETYDELDDAKFEKVLQTIAESREDFIKAKEIGIDISEPMNLLNKARDSLKDGDHRGAIDWAEKGREKVEELVEKHEKTELKIKKANEIVEGLRELDIELSDAEEMISEAESYLEDKDYENADKTIEECGEHIDKVAYEEVMGLIEEFEMDVLTAEEMGLEVPDYTDKLEEAIANTKSSEYVKAGEIAVENTSEVQELIEDDMETRIDNVWSIIERIGEEAGEEEEISEVKEVEGEMEEVEEILEEGRYRKAFNKLEETAESLKKWQVGEAEENLNKARDIVNLVKNLEVKDVDIEDHEESIKKAEEALEEDDYSTAIKRSSSVIGDLNNKLRKEAKDRFATAKMEVVKAKKAGVEIEDMRKRLIDCKKDQRDERYAEGMRLAIEVEEEAKELRERRKSSYEMISNLSERLTQLRREGKVKNVKPAKDILLQAKDSFQARDYTQAEKMAEQAKAKITELKGRSTFREKLEGVEEKIDRADNLGIDVSDIESIVDVAKEEMKDGNFEGAIERAEEAGEEVVKKMEESVEPELENTREIIRSAKEIGIDVSQPEDIMSETEELFSDGEYKEALEKIDKCQRRIDEIRNKSKRAASQVKKVKERMEEAEDLQADVKEAQDILNSAMDALKKDQYEEAINEAQLSREKIEQAEKERVENVLSRFNSKISEVKKEGINTALADNLMKRAEKAKEEGNYREAINLAMQSEGELERIELQQDIAKRSISTTHSKMEEAKEEGLKVDSADKMLDQAKRAYKGGFYVKAFDNAVKSGDKLTEVKRAHEEALELIDELEKVVEGARAAGKGVKGMRERLEEAKRAFENGRYEKAVSKAKNADKSIEELKAEVPDIIDELKGKIEDMKEEGRDVGKAKEKIDKARATFDMGDLLDAFDLISEAREEFGGEIFEEYKSSLDETVSLIKKAKKFGADVGEVEKMVGEARKLEERDVIKAKEKAEEALQKVEESLEPYSPKVGLEVQGKVLPDDWNTIDITMKNKGNGVAKNPEVSFEGAEVNEIDFPDMLKADEETTVSAEVKATDNSVKLIGKGMRIFDEKMIECSIEVEPSTGEYEIKEADGGESCQLCKGKIKSGLDMIECECGSTYHRPCGERKGKCPGCGTLFKEGEEKEEEEEEKKEESEEKKASKRVALKI